MKGEMEVIISVSVQRRYEYGTQGRAEIKMENVSLDELDKKALDAFSALLPPAIRSAISNHLMFMKEAEEKKAEEAKEAASE